MYGAVHCKSLPERAESIANAPSRPLIFARNLVLTDVVFHHCSNELLQAISLQAHKMAIYDVERATQ